MTDQAAAYPTVRHLLAEVIEREYGLADPANEGYRPEAFTLAGALLNALVADGYAVTHDDRVPRARRRWGAATDGI